MLESEIRKLTVEVARNNQLLEQMLEGENGSMISPTLGKTGVGSGAEEVVAPTQDEEKSNPSIVIEPKIQNRKELAEESRKIVQDSKGANNKKKKKRPKLDTVEDLDDAVRKYVKTVPGPRGVALVKDVMTQQFGIKRLSELDKAQYRAFLGFVDVAFQGQGEGGRDV